MNKNEIRNQVRKQKRNMSEDEIHKKSALICEQIWNLSQYRQTDEIYLYAAFNQEVRTEEIFRISRDLGKRVYYPKIEDNQMQFYEVQDLNEIMSGYQGIPEPNVGREASIPKQGALFFTPGLAFDRMGNRIGYGAGFYDKYFLRFGSEHVCKVAFAYEFQIYEELPTSRYDIAVDFILTPKGCITCIR